MKKIAFFVFGAAFLAFSCEKAAVVNEPEPTPETLTFTCVMPEEDPESKVSLDMAGKVAWEAGDEIMIHGGKDGATFQKVTLKASDISSDGKTATITMAYMEPYDRLSDGAGVYSSYYAQYPASAVPTGDNMYYECRFNDTKQFLMGACDVDNTFKFYHLSGVIAYKVSGSFASAVFSGNSNEAVAYNVYQARIRRDYDKTNNVPKDPRCYYWKPGNGSGTPVASSVYAHVPVTDGTTINYIYLPSGEGADGSYSVSSSGVNFTNGFKIQFFDDLGNEVKRVSTSTAKNIHAGQLLNLGDITSHLYTYTAPATHDSSLGVPADNSVYDLSKDGSANCYIVNGGNTDNADKVFKFKAYQGNSTNGVGKISSVEVLWTTWNDSNTPGATSVIADVDYDKQAANEYYEICFKMPATLHEGNAVIAAKNAGGQILWSWHIWVPKSAIATADMSNIFVGAVMMDRNLGALEPVSTTDGTSVYSLGLYYEWGRKDPFPGSKRLESGAGYALVAGTAPSVHSGGAMTIEETIKNPTEYAPKNGDAQGISDMDFTKWGKTKTIYDPCPPGYKLPYISRNSQTMLSTDYVTALPAAGFGFETSTTGYWVKVTDGSNEVVFPLAGYVEEGISTFYAYKQTVRGAIWYLCDSGSSPYHLNFRPSESRNRWESTHLNRGCSVRCVVQ